VNRLLRTSKRPNHYNSANRFIWFIKKIRSKRTNPSGSSNTSKNDHHNFKRVFLWKKRLKQNVFQHAIFIIWWIKTLTQKSFRSRAVTFTLIDLWSIRRSIIVKCPTSVLEWIAIFNIIQFILLTFIAARPYWFLVQDITLQFEYLLGKTEMNILKAY